MFVSVKMKTAVKFGQVLDGEPLFRSELTRFDISSSISGKNSAKRLPGTVLK